MNGISTISGALVNNNVGQTPRVVSQVESELNQLSKASESIKMNLAALVMKLHPIMRQDETLQQKAQAVNPEQNVVGLAQVIRDERKKLEYISDLVATYCGLLEL